MPYVWQLILSIFRKIKTLSQRFYFPNQTGSHMWLQPPVFMYSRLMLDNIIINLFSDVKIQTTDSAKKDLFSKIQDDRILLRKISLQDYSWKKRSADTKKTLRPNHLIEKYKLRKYLPGMLSIYIDEAYLEKKTNQFINNISNFNNKHIIQCYN